MLRFFPSRSVPCQGNASRISVAENKGRLFCGMNTGKHMTDTQESHALLSALRTRFSEEDAESLLELVGTCLRLVNPRYEDIALEREKKDECLLIAFEERIVLPAHSGPGGGWNDRSLRLEAGEFYTMPPLVWHLMCSARDSGRFSPEHALEQTLRSVLGEGFEQNAALIREARKHVRRGYLEAGLFGVLAQNLDLDLDLHETLDRYVLLGIASPYAKADVNTGLVWYEINPCLFW